MIRIFIGTEPKTEIPCQVLEYSIKKHASQPVQITRMLGPEWEKPIPKIRQGTGFSLRRWIIPEVGCGFKGKAIYMDADQLVLSDIAELWSMDDLVPNEHATVWCAYDFDKYTKRHLGGKRKAMQSSVMLIDCERASYWKTPELWAPLTAQRMRYIEFMHGLFFKNGEKEIQKITHYWNHFNAYEEGKTNLIHYTVEKTQPWYEPHHPCAGIWRDYLIEAIEAGAINRADFLFSLKRFGKPEPGDHRRTFGIHSKFADLVERFP